jgi:hypothetical protein
VLSLPVQTGSFLLRRENFRSGFLGKTLGGAGLQSCIYGPHGLAALAAEVHTVGNSGIASGAKARMVAGFSAGLKACSTRFHE